jgi:hypothetical protein
LRIIWFYFRKDKDIKDLRIILFNFGKRIK